MLREQPVALFQRATTSAGVRGASLATHLRVEIVGLPIGVDARLWVRRIRDGAVDEGSPSLSVELTWQAFRGPVLFPCMLAELSAKPSSSTWTELELRGVYWTPMGALGAALDAAIGHRIAESAANHFLDDVVGELSRELSDPAKPSSAGAFAPKEEERCA